MKTTGFEMAEQLDWRLPDAVVYPTGGGEGTIGIWKAIEEMKAAGWLAAKTMRRVLGKGIPLCTARA